MEDNILIIGSGAREHGIIRSLNKSKLDHSLYCIGSNKNPGIAELCKEFIIGDIENSNFVIDHAKNKNCNIAIIGPENPLAKGLADALWLENIGVIGPTKNLAQIETSKSFARKLMKSYNINRFPIFKTFDSMIGVRDFLVKLGDDFVVKYDGLAGGKGVKVSGEHLISHDDALNYCNDLIKNGGKFVIEEKLVGQEFSLMSFSDGSTLKHMPVVQDHKRAYENDQGPNTGGMGTYSDANHSLPFLNNMDIDIAKETNVKIIKALTSEFGTKYKGILYGGFMATKDGIKIIEYNARFGDPESMNVLTLLQTDFLEICKAIISEELHKIKIKFNNQATVCKYAVPIGYPTNPIKGEKIDISKVNDHQQLFFGSVDQKNDDIIEAGSRTLCIVAAGDTIEEAEKIVEKEISKVEGPLFHRADIGTKPLIESRIKHMQKIR